MRRSSCGRGSSTARRGPPEFLERLSAQARRVTREPVLLRLDARNDAIANMNEVLVHAEREEAATDFIIKWNRREQQPREWLRQAEAEGFGSGVRAGASGLRSSPSRSGRRHRGRDYDLRRVTRVTERTITAEGERLLHPEVESVEVDGWWTNLGRSASDQKVITSTRTTGPRSSSTASSRPNRASSDCSRGSSPPATWCWPAPRWRTTSSAGWDRTACESRRPRFAIRAERRPLGTVMQELMYRAVGGDPQRTAAGPRIRPAVAGWRTSSRACTSASSRPDAARRPSEVGG